MPSQSLDSSVSSVIGELEALNPNHRHRTVHEHDNEYRNRRVEEEKAVAAAAAAMIIAMVCRYATLMIA